MYFTQEAEDGNRDGGLLFTLSRKENIYFSTSPVITAPDVSFPQQETQISDSNPIMDQYRKKAITAVRINNCKLHI